MIMIATLLLTHLQNGKRMLLNATHKYKYCCFCFRMMSNSIAPNGSGLCVVALSRNLKLTTTLNRAITQNPCYVPFLFRNYDWNTISIRQRNTTSYYR